jgi:ABC transport system ATP-binding/permease protein
MGKMATVSTYLTDGKKTVEPRPAQKIFQNIPGNDGVLLQAKDLSFRTQAGARMLSDISFHIEPGELVVITTPGHSGKSTLLKSLAGLMKPTSGEITINGVSLYPNQKAFRSSIGYIPAEFSLPAHHTVVEILREAAQMRLPRNASSADRKQRVLTLLETFGLTPLADRRVGHLSKLDKHKLSIAVELTGNPGLLLLDEPADRLNPTEEVQITTLLQELSAQGLTIIQVNQHSRCAGLSDKVIILTPGGFLTWFGPAEEAFIFLRSFLPENSAGDSFGLDDVHQLLVSPQSADEAEWAKRYKAHPAYQKYVDDPLNNRYPDLMLETLPLIRLRSEMEEKLPPPPVPHVNGAQQLVLLVRRNLRLWWREKTWLMMLAVPWLAALFDFILSSPEMSDPTLGDPNRPPVVFGVLVFLDLLVSALLFQNEIFKDRAVYQRESRTTLLSAPYVLSKVWLVGAIGIYQGLVWTVIHFFATGLIASPQTLLAFGITFTLVAFIGGLLGLLASAFTVNEMMTTIWVLILTVPQLFLSTAIIPLEQLNSPFTWLSVVNPSRYAFETLLTASGYGREIASDPCWSLPAAQRNSLSDIQKLGCPCMGSNIFSICTIPGIHSFYSYVIEQPRPNPPQANSAIDKIPVQPLPQQGETLAQFTVELNRFSAQLESYLGNFDAYLSTLRQYPDTLANWQRVRSLVIGKAEGVIGEVVDRYGQGFNIDLKGHWAVLAAMSLGLIFLIIGIQQGKSIRTK